MFSSKQLIRTILACSLVIASLGVAVQPAQAASCTRYHTVQRGETLYKIGVRYGVTWRYLAAINNLSNPNRIYAGQRLCVATSATQPKPKVIPTFSITGVARDTRVTIRTANFPANDSFNVLMGAYGTAGVGGIKVDTIRSGQGGSFSDTFSIPAALRGARRIAIRLESPTSGYFAYNWFYNTTTGSGTGGGTNDDGYTGFPTFSIASVVRNTSVTIRMNNLPPNDTFNVLMGAYGTRAAGGTRVDRFSSGAGGNATATFHIPAGLQGATRIAIRIQSPTSGYFAYNWFYNTTTR